MKCSQVQERLSAFQDGELKPQEKEGVSEHLESCPACRERYAEMEKVWQGLGDFKGILPEPGFYGQLVKKINESHETRSPARFQWLFQFFSSPWVASTLLLAGILIGTFLGNFLAGSDLFPFRPGMARKSLEAVEVVSFRVFDPVPPGTLGEGYLRMVRNTEVQYR
jgi:anti-sigma factor RsiW